MRVAFLADSPSMHINIKAKYFTRKDDFVYLFAMRPRRGMRDRNIPLKYRENMRVEEMTHEESEWSLMVKNACHMAMVIRKNNIPLLHIIGMSFCPYGILLRFFGIKVVLENNGSDVILPPKSKLGLALYRTAYLLCNAVVQDSAVAKKAGIRLGAKKRNNQIVELGIDTKIFCPTVEYGVFREKYKIPKGAHVIFSPRALKPLYNIGEIIDTIKPIVERFPDTYYVFCSYFGNKTYENRIEKEGLLKNVIYLGYVDNEKEMPYIYRDADIVLSIPNSDSSPRSVYEGIACGASVIVSDLPWIGKKFRDDRELFIVPLHGKDALQNLMIEILEGKKKIDGHTGFERVKKILDYKSCADKLRRLYQSI